MLFMRDVLLRRESICQRSAVSSFMESSMLCALRVASPLLPSRSPLRTTHSRNLVRGTVTTAVTASQRCCLVLGTSSIQFEGTNTCFLVSVSILTEDYWFPKDEGIVCINGFIAHRGACCKEERSSVHCAWLSTSPVFLRAKSLSIAQEKYQSLYRDWIYGAERTLGVIWSLNDPENSCTSDIIYLTHVCFLA